MPSLRGPLGKRLVYEARCTSFAPSLSMVNRIYYLYNLTTICIAYIK